jgi:hypothetical protein
MVLLLTLSPADGKPDLIWAIEQALDTDDGDIPLCVQHLHSCLCLTHLMEIVVIWYPFYWMSAAVKGVTAAAPGVTAFAFATKR